MILVGPGVILVINCPFPNLQRLTHPTWSVNMPTEPDTTTQEDGFEATSSSSRQGMKRSVLRVTAGGCDCAAENVTEAHDTSKKPRDTSQKPHNVSMK